MTSKSKKLQSHHAQLRLLLALWDLGATQQEVKKGLLTKRIISKGQKIADYQEVLQELQEKGAIVLSKTGYTLTSPIGLAVLGETLRNSESQLEGSVVGTWVANALLRWIAKANMEIVKSSVVDDGVINQKISDYEEFRSELLKIFEKLDKGYAYGGLIPIWHIRRELGDRVERDHFSDWLMEMQAEQLLYLQSGEARGATEDQKRDSINSEIRGLLFFASKPL